MFVSIGQPISRSNNTTAWWPAGVPNLCPNPILEHHCLGYRHWFWKCTPGNQHQMPFQKFQLISHLKIFYFFHILPTTVCLFLFKIFRNGLVKCGSNVKRSAFGLCGAWWNALSEVSKATCLLSLITADRAIEVLKWKIRRMVYLNTFGQSSCRRLIIPSGGWIWWDISFHSSQLCT